MANAKATRCVPTSHRRVAGHQERKRSHHRPCAPSSATGTAANQSKKSGSTGSMKRSSLCGIAEWTSTKMSQGQTTKGRRRAARASPGRSTSVAGGAVSSSQIPR